MRWACEVFLEAQKWEDSNWTRVTRHERFYWGPGHHPQPPLSPNYLPISVCSMYQVSVICSTLIHLYEHNNRELNLWLVSLSLLSLPQICWRGPVCLLEQGSVIFLKQKLNCDSQFKFCAMVTLRQRPNPLVCCIKISLLWLSYLLSLSTLVTLTTFICTWDLDM